MSLLISGGTIIDGTGRPALAGHSILIERDRIVRIAPDAELASKAVDQHLDVAGKFVIPGLMDANVHLLLDMRLENLVRYEDRYEDLIVEASQVALKNGLTTVFDTWGPRRHLIEARNKIAAGTIVGARTFCAGNIVGLGGPFSEDFLGRTAEIASAALASQINEIWAENVGQELTWMSPASVANEVSIYIGRGIDFVKFASSEHRIPIGRSAFLALSPAVQEAIVAEAHAAGLTAQAHTQSIEAVRVSAEAGVDIIQHCNITGPVPLPEKTIRLLEDRKVAATVFPITRQRRDWFAKHGDVLTQRLFTVATTDTNVTNLINSRVRILLATDAGLLAADTATDAALGAVYTGNDNLFQLGEGHFNWLKAMEEMGMAPMEALMAATSNVADAYGKLPELGTLEEGKIADILVLDRDPLMEAKNYRSIHTVIKDGTVVDTTVLPSRPFLLVAGSEQTVRAHGLGGAPSCCCSF